MYTGVTKLDLDSIGLGILLLELVGGKSCGGGEELMAETDAKNGPRPRLAHHSPQFLHRALAHLQSEQNS